MKKLVALCLTTGVSLASIAGCGAGKDPKSHGNTDFGKAGSAGEPGSGGGLAVAGSAGAAGTANVAGASPGGTPATGGRGGAGGGGGGEAPIPFGADCDRDEECGTQGICYVGPGSSLGTCRAECSVDFAGESGGCPAGQLCVRTRAGSAAACLVSCDPTVNPYACGELDWCLPDPIPTYTGGTAVPGLCVNRGKATADNGAPCEGGSCAPGFVCYQGAMPTVGVPHCTAPCDPGAVAGSPQACGEGEICRRTSATAGACLRICDPYTTNTCPSGEWCFPFHEQLADGTSIVEGHCVQPGERDEGEPCVLGECGEGLLCAQPSTPYPQSGLACRRICVLGLDNDCGDAVCSAVAGDTLELSVCQPNCELLGEGSEAGCGDDEWCAPSAVSGLNACTVPGSASTGESCMSSAECAAGNYCDCRFGSDSACLEQGRCELVCDPQASGSCSEGSVCVPEVRVGVVAPFGVCRDVCDFDGMSGCSDAEESCVPQELLGTPSDACLDVPSGLSLGQPCGRPRVELHEPCQPLAMCVVSERSGEAECVDVCRPEAGGFETVNHPDCADPEATCRQISLELPYGHCR